MMQFSVDLASAGDDAAIRSLYRRQPMPGRISVAFEREPNFSLGCRITGKDCQIVVARTTNSGEIAGVACRSKRQMYLNGHEQRLGYLGQLRIDERFRGRWLVSRGFRLLRQLHDRDPLPAYLVSIVGETAKPPACSWKIAARYFLRFTLWRIFARLPSWHAVIALRFHATPALRRLVRSSSAKLQRSSILAERAASFFPCGPKKGFGA